MRHGVWDQPSRRGLLNVPAPWRVVRLWTPCVRVINDTARTDRGGAALNHSSRVVTTAGWYVALGWTFFLEQSLIKSRALFRPCTNYSKITWKAWNNFECNSNRIRDYSICYLQTPYKLHFRARTMVMIDRWSAGPVTQYKNVQLLGHQSVRVSRGRHASLQYSTGMQFVSWILGTLWRHNRTRSTGAHASCSSLAQLWSYRCWHQSTSHSYQRQCMFHGATIISLFPWSTDYVQHQPALFLCVVCCD